MFTSRNLKVKMQFYKFNIFFNNKKETVEVIKFLYIPWESSINSLPKWLDDFLRLCVLRPKVKMGVFNVLSIILILDDDDYMIFRLNYSESLSDSQRYLIYVKFEITTYTELIIVWFFGSLYHQPQQKNFNHFICVLTRLSM